MAVPVILDTDIGHDVDDVWALAFLLRCPELDVRLVTTCTGDTVYRARLVARILQLMGREDIPIGIGIPLDENPHTHAAWLGDYQLEDYPGTVHTDGIGALCKTILGSEEEVSLICIGPLPNIAAALARAPEITNRARFVGMHGSIRRGYLDAPKPMREFNVKMHALSCRAVFEADWPKVITPLDTCGNVIIDGERFARIRERAQHPDTPAGDPARISFENHVQWIEAVGDWPILSHIDPLSQSSILYDVVAVYLGFADKYLEMEILPITITPDGKTLVDDGGSPVSCALAWKDKPAFLDLVVERLAGTAP
ncbi:MAG: nucleoside hydrolase [Gammaproteobacteria bacterium]|nr:MAG: nucleoside hydrolase [Gammaproteobacteria bacterium]